MTLKTSPVGLGHERGEDSGLMIHRSQRKLELTSQPLEPCVPCTHQPPLQSARDASNRLQASVTGFQTELCYIWSCLLEHSKSLCCLVDNLMPAPQLSKPTDVFSLQAWDMSAC